MSRAACFLLAIVCACGALAACSIGRGGRNLSYAVALSTRCGDDFTYEPILESRRLYRVWACPVPGSGYTQTGIYHCSRRRCDNLSAAARQRHAYALGCPIEQIRADEMPEPFVLRTIGCGQGMLQRCEMRNQATSCDSLGPVVQYHPPVAAP